MKRLLTFIYGLMMIITAVLGITKCINSLSWDNWYSAIFIIIGTPMFYFGVLKLNKAIE